MATTGTGSIDFGAFPGASDATLVITGQGSILAGSRVSAWLEATATADHSADEHRVEDISVLAGAIVPGTGFTIYATYMGMGDTMPYGLWTVGWAWT